MLARLLQIDITVPERAEEIVEQVKADPTLQAMLVGIGVVTAMVFAWGVVKQAFRAALFGGALSVIAWVWYFNIR